MNIGVRLDDLRRRNRALVIAAMRRHDHLSRTGLAATTGLSHSTISSIAADLMQEGVIAETTANDAATRRGRPQVAMALRPAAASVAAGVLSLNSLTIAVLDYKGDILTAGHRRIETLALSANTLATEVSSFMTNQIANAGADSRVRRITLAVQGTTDAGGRILRWSPITPNEDLPLADHLEKTLNIPTTIQNDCNMMAEALRWRPGPHQHSDVIAILLAHGIGMGMISKGELFTGTRSSGAEFGHMNHIPGGASCRCGKRGCVEAYSGSYAIWRRANGLDDSEPPAADISPHEINALAIRARNGDMSAQAAFAEAGQAVGYALGNLFALIDPAPVVFVGSGTQAFDLIEPHLREALSRTAGGEHGAGLVYETIANDEPLIQAGGAMLALRWVDDEIFAPGEHRTDYSSRMA